MATTTVRMDTHTRDRLAALARDRFGGVTQEAALNRLLDEHEMHQVHVAYARLRDDPKAWAEYSAELDEWDSTVSDGLSGAEDEYPDYNR